MKTVVRLISLTVVCLSLFAGATVAQEKPLYERLGGYDAIAAVVHDFVSRMEADEKMGLFVGFSTDTKARLRQHVVDFVCAGSGGPCTYTGRSMKLSHRGAGITKEVWDLSGKHLGDSLAKFNVPEQEQKDLFAIIAPLEGDIVDNGS